MLHHLLKLTCRLAGFVAVSVTVLTVSFQSVQAALANPMKALKNE